MSTEINQKWVIICYGNILRSQVLEQYLRYYSKLFNQQISFFSAGTASENEFPDKEKLLNEISRELQKRDIPHSLNRKPWNKLVEEKVKEADIVVMADKNVKKTVLEKMNHEIDEKAFTFYEFISEGEIDFQDTYDYENKRQDPKRFRDAFNELDRIARKMMMKYRDNQTAC